MIEVNVRNRSLFDYLYFDDEVLSNNDYGYDEINKKLNGRPCVGEFEPVKWYVWAINQPLHDALPPYDLYQKTELTKDGLENKFYIDFPNKEFELYFKIKYMSA